MKNAAREIASSEDILYFFLCLLDGAHTKAKAAQREAEAKRDEELRQKGYQCEDIENWMKSRTITADGQKLTLWEWYQRERRDAGDDL